MSKCVVHLYNNGVVLVQALFLDDGENLERLVAIWKRDFSITHIVCLHKVLVDTHVHEYTEPEPWYRFWSSSPPSTRTIKIERWYQDTWIRENDGWHLFSERAMHELLNKHSIRPSEMP